MNEIKQDENRFYIGEDAENALAEITFTPEGEDKIVVDHTYVSGSLKGQGIGGKLVKRVVDYALEENKKIVPTCSFAKKVIMENEEYKRCLCE